MHLVDRLVSQATKAVHPTNQLKGRGECNQGSEILMVPALDKGIKGSIAKVLGSTNARRSSRQHTRPRSDTETGRLARELDAINVDLQTAGTPRRSMADGSA